MCLKERLGFPKDEISPFSRLNGDLKVAEWRLNGDGKGRLDSHDRPFIRLNSTHILVTLGTKITPDVARALGLRIKNVYYSTSYL